MARFCCAVLGGGTCADYRPGADTRKQLSESLARFVPTIIQSSSQIATRLELFRTETLASFEPVDKTKAAEDAEIGEILDSTMGLESFVIPEMPIATSRAGLYIYLNAAVSNPPPPSPLRCPLSCTLS